MTAIARSPLPARKLDWLLAASPPDDDLVALTVGRLDNGEVSPYRDPVATRSRRFCLNVAMR
jgi:hypothetical protein